MAASRTTGSEGETIELGRELARRLEGDGTLLLEGPMGSGKTVLARGVAAEAGVDPSEIQSPTFTLIHEHEGRGGLMLYHLDLYRLDPGEAAAIGVDEILESPGLKVVEWAERLPRTPTGVILRVVVSRPSPGVRRFDIQQNSGRPA